MADEQPNNHVSDHRILSGYQRLRDAVEAHIKAHRVEYRWQHGRYVCAFDQAPVGHDWIEGKTVPHVCPMVRSLAAALDSDDSAGVR